MYSEKKREIFQNAAYDWRLLVLFAVEQERGHTRRHRPRLIAALLDNRPSSDFIDRLVFMPGLGTGYWAVEFSPVRKGAGTPHLATCYARKRG